MRTPTLVLSGAAALAAALAAGSVSAGPGGHTLHGRVALTSPSGMTEPGPSGRIDALLRPADPEHPESSRLRIDLHGLAVNAALTLWADDPTTPDPALVQFGDATTNFDGNARYSRDTRRGDALPFGATLADLAGKAVEVHDAASAVLLAGVFPTPDGPPPPEPTLHGRGDLARPDPAPLPLADGRVDEEVRPAHGADPGSSRLRIDLHGLTPGGVFTLWADDPATPVPDVLLTQFGEVTADDKGHAKAEFDTRKGDALPFGATLDALAGQALEVHDAAAAVVLGGTFPTPSSPPRHDPALHGRSSLTPPPGAPIVAGGRIDAQVKAAHGHDAASSRLKIDLRGLSGGATYTLWADDPTTPDPTLVQFGEVTARDDGKATFNADTKKGGTLPFGATLADLAGQAVEVHDAASAVVLTGSFPALN